MFNALKYTDELEKAGFTKQQAEASMRILIDVMNENFATQSDLKETEMKLESVILGVKSDLKETEMRFESNLKETEMRLESLIVANKSEIKELDYKLTIKLGTMMTVAIGATATIVKLIQSLH